MLRAELVGKLVTSPEAGIKLLGFSTFCFGVAGFLQRDFTAFWQPVPQDFPFREPLVYVSAVLLMLSGLALFIPRMRRQTAALQICLFLAYACSWLSRPMPGALLGIAEHLAIVVGAAIVWAQRSPEMARHFSPAIARTVYGCCSIMFGLSHIIGVEPTARMIPSWLPGNPVFWAVLTGAAHLAVGLALIINRLAVPATRWAGLMYFCFAAVIWIPGAVIHPDQWLRWAGTAITLAMLAAVWLVGDYLRETRASANDRVLDSFSGLPSS